MRRTKIVATIGPASRDPEVLVRMVEAGMDVARLNFSHGSHELHAETAQRVREAAGRAGRPVAILQDLPGPKLRIGALKDDTAELEVGGSVASRQGLNIPGPLDILPAVPEEDLEHLRAGQKIGVDLVALSFVR